jgi:hypothetical protein
MRGVLRRMASILTRIFPWIIDDLCRYSIPKLTCRSWGHVNSVCIGLSIGDKSDQLLLIGKAIVFQVLEDIAIWLVLVD